MLLVVILYGNKIWNITVLIHLPQVTGILLQINYTIAKAKSSILSLFHTVPAYSPSIQTRASQLRHWGQFGPS